MAIEQKRIEAAARAIEPFVKNQFNARAVAEIAAKILFPELASDPPTGWLAPMEATKEMLDAAEDRFEDFKDEGWSSTGDGYRYEYTDIRSGFAHGMYEAARDAHLKEQGHE